MTKLLLRRKAISLRKAGYSYSYIQKKTGVSKSTLSDWLFDLPYKVNQTTISNIAKARLLANKARREIRLDSIRRARISAKNELGKLSMRDLYILGLGIYIGEGSKTHNIIRVVNSDPRIIKTSIVWFKKIFSLHNENFSIRIHSYPDNDEKKVIEFWSGVTGLQKSSFLRTVIDKRQDKKRKNLGKLRYGTAHLTVKKAGSPNAGVFLSRRIMAMIDLVYKKAGMV